MRVPHAVPRDAFEAFRCSEETMRLSNELERTLRAENEEWDRIGVPDDLKTQALRVIAANWLKDPIFEELPTSFDQDYLLEILPLGIDLKTVMAKLNFEIYWQRMAEARWKVNDPAEHGNSWRQLYCERHLWEYLEGLNPTYFESVREECEELLELLHKYVHVLKLRELQPFKNLVMSRPFQNEDPPLMPSREEEVHHIPMDLILEKLPYLHEIYFNIGVIRLKDDFDLRDFEFSVEDSLKIGKGAKKLIDLVKFSLTRSNLTQPRVAALLQGLATSNSIREINLSYCKLEDEGALAVGAFLIHRSPDSQLTDLSLGHNRIGPEGLAGLVQGIILGETKRSSIKSLNLNFNNFGDDGATHISALLLRLSSLEYLNISCCNIGSHGAMKIAEVLGSRHIRFKNLNLDLSNNHFGTMVEKAFEAAAKRCIAITGIDIRICGFNKESENLIIESVNRNKSNFKTYQRKRFPSIYVRNERMQSLVSPPQFALFQSPHDFYIPIDMEPDDGDEDSFQIHKEN